MAKQKKESSSEGSVLENPEALSGKAEEFLADKKKRNLTIIIGSILILAIVGLFLYRSNLENQNREAQEEMFRAIYYFESDSIQKALNGDGINYGFLKIINDYSGTEAANLANLYAGSCYMSLGDYKSAVRYLESFSASDYVVQARAYALTGDCHMEMGNYEEAVLAYEEAVEYKPNASYTPAYLQKLALAREKAGNYTSAAKAYQQLIKEYPKSNLITEAKKHKARLEGLAE
jgi:tetratricopeptide (TPR) repeat protein